MKVLLDECLPHQLKSELPDCKVSTVTEMGWSGKTNGILLRLAEHKFDVFLTMDRGVAYQNNLKTYEIAVISLAARNNRFSTLRPLIPKIQFTLRKVQPHEFVRIEN